MNANGPTSAFPARLEAPLATDRPAGFVRLLAGLVMILCSTAATGGDLQIHGFGTVGAAYFVDKPEDWAYTRDLIQRESDADFRADLDSVVGIQANYQATSSLELVGQASLALLDPDARPDDFLELAFVGWRPDAAWNVRLGRVNFDAYLISDHRDVGFTYQFIRPPVEYYSRMPASLDGGDVTRTWTIGATQWQAKLFAGTAGGGTGTTRLRTSELVGLMASRESYGLLLRISALHGRTANNLSALEPLVEGLRQIQQLPVPEVAAQAAGLEAALRTRHMNSNYIAAAVAYDRNDWLFTAELNRCEVTRNPAIGFSSGYVSAGRRFGPFSAVVTQSFQRREGDATQAPDWATPLAPLGAELAEQAQQLAVGTARTINRFAGHQSTTSIGLRWDFAPRLAFKAQWDHVKARRNGGALWLAADGNPASADLIAVAADFVF
jgi:hypothetical protein